MNKRKNSDIKQLLIKGLRNPKKGCRYLVDIITHPKIFRNINAVEGMISLRTGVLLFNAVISNRHLPGDIFEVGAFKGLSTCILSLAAKKVGKTVKSFELFTGLPTAEPSLDGFFTTGMFSSSKDEYESNIKKYGCRDCVDLIIGDARDNLSQFGKSCFSVAFIDTDVYSVTRDVLMGLAKLAKGGEVLIIHDYYSPGIEKAIEDFKRLSAFDLIQQRIEARDLTIQYKLKPKTL